MRTHALVASMVSLCLSPAALANDDPADVPIIERPVEPVSVEPTSVEVVEEVTTRTKRRSRHVEGDDRPTEPPVIRASRPPPPEEPAIFDDWARHASFFVGGVGGMAFAPGAIGPAGTLGVELGVAAKSGIGFGLSMLGLVNPPAVPSLSLPKAAYGFGAMADVRWYIQTIEPLALYPALSLGFAAGPAEDTGVNAVLPLVNAGFGARMTFGQIYFALGLGVTGVLIPFLNISMGWTPGAEV